MRVLRKTEQDKGKGETGKGSRTGWTEAREEPLDGTGRPRHRGQRCAWGVGGSVGGGGKGEAREMVHSLQAELGFLASDVGVTEGSKQRADVPDSSPHWCAVAAAGR